MPTIFGCRKPGRRAGLLMKPPHLFFRSEAAREDHLQGNDPIEVALPSLVHNPHAAAARFFQKVIVPENLPGGVRNHRGIADRRIGVAPGHRCERMRERIALPGCAASEHFGQLPACRAIRACRSRESAQGVARRGRRGDSRRLIESRRHIGRAIRKAARRRHPECRGPYSVKAPAADAARLTYLLAPAHQLARPGSPASRASARPDGSGPCGGRPRRTAIARDSAGR